jgi:hypothetical protein
MPTVILYGIDSHIRFNTSYKAVCPSQSAKNTHIKAENQNIKLQLISKTGLLSSVKAILLIHFPLVTTMECNPIITLKEYVYWY